MRAICIDDKLSGGCDADFIIKERQTYDILRAFQRGKPEWWWYELKIQPGVGYAVERFIPISDISETEFIRNYNLEKV